MIGRLRPILLSDWLMMITSPCLLRDISIYRVPVDVEHDQERITRNSQFQASVHVHRGLHCLIWIWYEEGEI